eukprot:14872908-Alexandrium_andersonii.AAC.1
MPVRLAWGTGAPREVHIGGSGGGGLCRAGGSRKQDGAVSSANLGEPSTTTSDKPPIVSGLHPPSPF